MCYNADVSLGAYIFGMTGSMMLYYRGYKSEAIFYFVVIQMQLIEYYFHTNPVCNDTNKNATIAGIIINHFEPIALWIGIVYFSGISLPGIVNKIVLLYAIASIWYTYKVIKTSDECTVVTEESSPHLHWKWTSGEYWNYYYGLFLIVLILLSIYGLGENGVMHAILVGVSFAISYKIYGTKHSVGAMWCLMAAFSPWLLNIIYKK